jgi:hypothetical protein
MLVEEFELVPHEEGTFFLKLNGNIIAEYFYNLEAEFERLMQIDVCSHCYYPGCSDNGFIEVFDFNNYIVWKEPLSSKYASSHREFQSHSNFIQGIVFWTRAKYIEFTSLIKQMNRSIINCFGSKPTLIDLMDMWRLEASKIYSPEGVSKYSIKQIYENRIGLYNEDLSEEQCNRIFNQAINIINSETTYEIIEINHLMKPIVMMFDTPIYKEWKSLYILNDEVLYSIGEGLVVRLS